MPSADSPVIMSFHSNTHPSMQTPSANNSSTNSGTISLSSNITDPHSPSSPYKALALQQIQFNHNSLSQTIVPQMCNNNTTNNHIVTNLQIQPNRNPSLPKSVKGAPVHLRQAIRKQQNSRSAKKSRLRRKENARAFRERFDQQCTRLRELEERVNFLVNELGTDSIPDDLIDEEEDEKDLNLKSTSITDASDSEQIFPQPQNNIPQFPVPKIETCLENEPIHFSPTRQITLNPTTSPNFSVSNPPLRQGSQDDEWLQLLDVCLSSSQFDDTEIQ